MDQRRTLIKDFEKQIDSTEADIQELVFKTGEYLFENAKKDTRTTAQDEYDGAKQQLDLRKQYEDSVQRIETVVERMAEISRELAENKNQSDAIVRSNQPVFEQIGAAAFEYLRKDPGMLSQYREMFAEVQNQIEDIENIEQDIHSLQSNRSDRKFFEKIADTGQMTYLKGVKLIRGKTMPKLYRDAGTKLAETSFLETTGNDQVQAAAKPYLENKDALEALAIRQKKLEDELAALDSELTGLGVDKRSEKRVEELKSGIEAAAAKYREKISAIAQKVRSNPPETIAAKDSYKEFIEKIEKAEEKITHYRENITKLEAAIEVDNLTGQINRMNESIADHRQRISDHERSITDLEKRIEESKAERERYEEIRGPEEITLQS